jgi:hypothetical protein
MAFFHTLLQVAVTSVEKIFLRKMSLFSNENLTKSHNGGILYILYEKKHSRI